MPNPSPWFVYILHCADNSYYTGITTDLNRRLKQHNNGTGAKYTAAKKPTQLIYHEQQPNRSQATKRELELKKLTHQQKQQFIANFRLFEKS